MTSLKEIEEYNRQASLPNGDGGAAAAKAKQAAEAKARAEFQQTMFGTKRREDQRVRSELWEKHKRLIDSDWHNWNFYRVAFPTSIFATDPVSGAPRQPGEIDRAEFLLEDISIRAYIAVHGSEVAPSGLHASVNTTAGPNSGFIVPEEKAKLLLERYGQEFDIQEARIRKLKADTEDRLVAALDPWKWNNGKVDYDLIDRIEKASSEPAHISPLYGTKIPKRSEVIGEGVDDLIARAIRYDRGPGSDRSLAYALITQFKDNISFKPRMLLLGRELGDDEAIYDLFRYESLYGAYATEHRNITRLTPIHVPEWLRYGTQEQLEANLQDELNSL